VAALEEMPNCVVQLVGMDMGACFDCGSMVLVVDIAPAGIRCCVSMKPVKRRFTSGDNKA
jgi:hypothetical protein